MSQKEKKGSVKRKTTKEEPRYVLPAQIANELVRRGKLDEKSRKKVTTKTAFTGYMYSLGWPVTDSKEADFPLKWNGMSIYHPVSTNGSVKTALTHRDALTAYKTNSYFRKYVENRNKAEKLSYEQAWATYLNKQRFIAPKTLDAPFGPDFQYKWMEHVRYLNLINPAGVFALDIITDLFDFLKCWTHQCDRRINEAYRLFWQQNIIVDNWLARAALLNWIILSAPTLSSPIRVYRAEPELPHYAIGSIIPIRRMLATSLSLAFVTIGGGFYNEKQNCCAYEIILPPGFPVLSIHHMGVSEYEDEKEILLPATFDARGLNPTYGLQIVGKKTVKMMDMLYDVDEREFLDEYISSRHYDREQYDERDFDLTVFVCVPVPLSIGKSFTDAEVWEGPLRSRFSKKRAPKLDGKGIAKKYDDSFWRNPQADKLRDVMERLRDSVFTMRTASPEIDKLRQLMIDHPDMLLPQKNSDTDETMLNIKLALINQDIQSFKEKSREEPKKKKKNSTKPKKAKKATT